MIDIKTRARADRTEIELCREDGVSRTYIVPEGTEWLPVTKAGLQACLVTLSDEIGGAPTSYLVPYDYSVPPIDAVSDKIIAAIDGMRGIPDDALLRLYAGEAVYAGARSAYDGGAPQRTLDMFRDRIAAAAIRLRVTRALPAGRASADHPITYIEKDGR